MVGISGEKTRTIELKKFDDYEVAVFGNWKNWDDYMDRYLSIAFTDKDGWVYHMLPELQWQWKQNHPELITEDLLLYDIPGIPEQMMRDIIYADLLYRGVNKAFFMRYAFIRYKKMLQLEAKSMWNEIQTTSSTKELWYSKGYYDATVKHRAEIKTILCSPRYIIWNGDRPGLATDTKISRGWLQLIERLWSIKFPK